MKRYLPVHFLLTLFSLCFALAALADNGHDLWLHKHPAKPVTIICKRNSPTLLIAIQELKDGWQGAPNASVSLTVKSNPLVKNDGYQVSATGITAATDIGILYGVYEMLRRQATGDEQSALVSNPSYQRRILDHWDNLDGSVERGYAGRSIFWRSGADSLRVTNNDVLLWKEYARANASIGINGAVLNNVNASPKILSADALQRVKAITDVLRPYGVKVYLSVNFASPSALGGLNRSDPLDANVIKWWKNKAKEIYTEIPDFGGFLVKANSEGQPGPQDFHRTHVDGANTIADALQPYDGIVMWRAFVYNSTDKDRAKQAYNEFVPLDGKFRDNVIIQVKNGPIDFQPREPFSPLFGAMKQTSVMPEFQITQEYLGHEIQLVFLSTLWEECLKSDTYQKGEGSTVAKCTDGSLFPQKFTAIAGVSNIGLDMDWTGHPFAQANWYAFGRLAWDDKLTSEAIADEWIKLTFADTNDNAVRSVNNPDWQLHFLSPVKQMMLESREAAVNYSMPLGLHHIFSQAYYHYGPGPWYAPEGVRVDWTPPYYHKADTLGIGFDRTHIGSDAVSQYHEPLASQFSDLSSCPEMYLLWFHHVPWNYRMKSGKTLWDELCYHYDTGVKQVRHFQTIWDAAKPYVDDSLFADVQSRLRRQARDAQFWKDACLLYFQQFSKQPIPLDIERPVHDLDYLEKTVPLKYANDDNDLPIF